MTPHTMIFEQSRQGRDSQGVSSNLGNGCVDWDGDWAESVKEAKEEKKGKEEKEEKKTEQAEKVKQAREIMKMLTAKHTEKRRVDTRIYKAPLGEISVYPSIPELLCYPANDMVTAGLSLLVATWAISIVHQDGTALGGRKGEESH